MMRRAWPWKGRGFLLMELALALVVIGGIMVMLIPLLSMQGQLDTARRDTLAMQQATDALLRQAVVGLGLPGPIKFAEGDVSLGTAAASHVELSSTLAVLAPGWAGALPGQALGVPTVSPLQTAYWYDVQPSLRADADTAFYPAVIEPSAGGTWGFAPITDQFDPDFNKRMGLPGVRKMSTGGIRSQLCRNLNSLQAIEQAIRQHPSNEAALYNRDLISITLPRVWASGYENQFTWDQGLGYATPLTQSTTAVFENSSAAAFVVVRRQPPALRRLDRQNVVYGQAGTSGLDQAMASRGDLAYPSSIQGARGFRVYENPLTPSRDDPASDAKDYDGRVQAVSLNQLAETLRQAGLCTAAAEACKANQLFVRFANYVNSAPASGSPQGLTLRWQLMDYVKNRSPAEYVQVQSGDVSSGSTTSGACLDAFATDVASAANTRYLRISFISPTGAEGYVDADAAALGYWYRGGILVDPTGTSTLPAPDNGINRWRNLSALSAAEAGKTVTISCTGSQSVQADGKLLRSGGSNPTCTVTQLP